MLGPSLQDKEIGSTHPLSTHATEVGVKKFMYIYFIILPAKSSKKVSMMKYCRGNSILGTKSFHCKPGRALFLMNFPGPPWNFLVPQQYI